MPEQVAYYNQFGEQHKESILACPEPHLWTTDYNEQGRVYHEMKERIAQQQQLIEQYFDPALPVIDVGCGFGRQAYWLAKKGYSVIGVDSSEVFIDIANSLFAKHKLQGTFIVADIMKYEILLDLFDDIKYQQFILLDVLEHIPPVSRSTLFENINMDMKDNATLIVSIPHVKDRWTSQLNNKVRRSFTQHFSYFRHREEHPYPIPDKKEILRLCKNNFSVQMFQSTPETDYYILRENSHAIL